MKKQPEAMDLRLAAPGRGKTIAVIGVSDAEILDIQPGISLERGSWEGKPAIVIRAEPSALPSREAYESDLESLHEISFELSLCQDVDGICRDAVRLGREKLGIDRLSVWFVDRDDPRLKVGTWGIDESGNLRDEHGATCVLLRSASPTSFYKGRSPLYVGLDEACLDHQGNEVGRGSKLIAPLWDSHSLIGELAADNLLTHREFSPEKKEAFVILSRIVANLVSLKRAEAELKYLASTDSLTGTVNRRTALIILEKHIAQCRRTGSPLTLCLADLDGLKLVNDAYGHAAGDEYIRRSSAALIGAVRGSDTVGRIGGDEFLVVFPDCRGDVVSSIMEKVNAQLAASAKPGSYRARLSWGIASLGEAGAHIDCSGSADLQRCIDMLLEEADQKMYDNKRAKGCARPRIAGEPELAF